MTQSLDRTQSKNICDIGVGEEILFTADFGPFISGDELITVESIEQVSGEGTLTLGDGAINLAGEITVEDEVLRQASAVQFAAAATLDTIAGDYLVRVIAGTRDGDTKRLDCRFRAWE